MTGVESGIWNQQGRRRELWYMNLYRMVERYVYRILVTFSTTSLENAMEGAQEESPSEEYTNGSLIRK